MEEDRETGCAGCVYQSSYTGMKETDLLLGAFARCHLAGLSDHELDQNMKPCLMPAMIAFISGWWRERAGARAV